MQISRISKATTFLTLSVSLLLCVDFVCSQVPYHHNNIGIAPYGQNHAVYQTSAQYFNHQTAITQETPVYTASREMLPTNPTVSGAQPIQENTAIPSNQLVEQKKDNPFTAFYKKVTKSMKPSSGGSAISEQNNGIPSPDAPTATITEKENTEKSESYISSILKPTSKKKEDIDDGQDLIAEMELERSFSERDYVASATKAKKATSKSLYTKGMEEEVTGNYQAAIRSYNAFIQANKKQTTNGTLAAPYHRLALIAWKQQEAEKADVYFRYGLKYALGGNIPVIAGDYSLFLIDQGRLEQAEIILRNTLLHYPKDQRLLVSLGRCIARRSKPVEAMRYLSSTLGEEQAYQELAMIYHEKGEYEMARQMQFRRDEFLAQKRQPYYVAPYQQYAGTSQSLTPVVNVPLPTTPPPVMENPRGMTTHATLTPTIPFPTLSDPTIPKMQADTSTISSPVWPEMESPNNTNNPEAALEVPKAPPMPVSKVFHYPADSPQPIYHQYIGNQYPQSVPSVVSQETSQTVPQNSYYMMSTVPQNMMSTMHETVPYPTVPPPIPTAATTPAPISPVLSPWASNTIQPQAGGYPPTYRSGNLSAQPMQQY